MKLVALAAVTNMGAAMAFSVEQNFLTVAGVLLTTVGVVVSFLNWLDKRIDKKIKDYADKVTLQFDNVLLEVRHVKELLNGETSDTMPVPPRRAGHKG